MNSDDLKTFLTLADTGSVSAAADELRLTQPAVSKRIARLESLLGTTLFDRGTRPLLTTEAGECLLPRAQQILNELEDAKTAVENLLDGDKGTLRLACSHHIGLHYLPTAIQHFQRSFPHVALSLHFVGSEEAPELLLKRVVDIALMTLPQTLAPPLSSVLRYQDPLVFVVGLRHPLNALDTVQLNDLAGHPALLPDQSTETFRHVQQLFEQHHLALQPAIPTNYLETLRMMVSVGLGWSVLPRSLVDHTLNIIKPLGVAPINRQLGALIHAQRPPSRRSEGFIHSLESVWRAKPVL